VEFNPKNKRRVLINITSLIDVMFLLLIFFMVTSTFLDQPGMKLELPSAESAEVARVEKLVIYISSDNEVVFNGQPVDLDDLEETMRVALPDIEDRTLVLNADRTVQHGTVIRVMDIAKKLGLERLVIGIKKEEDKKPR
jgi:biopolymer transport protein ExbD